jgi:hypothetical protein
MTSPQKLHRLLIANEDFRRHAHSGYIPQYLNKFLNNNYWKIQNKPGPHNKNTLIKLKFIRARTWNPRPRSSSNRPRPLLPWHKAAAALGRAETNVNAIYGQGRIRAKQAATILKLAEYRAARAIAKALSSNAVLKRVQEKRAARNFIREELGLYKRPNSQSVRPSNVKARRILRN